MKSIEDIPKYFKIKIEARDTPELEHMYDFLFKTLNCSWCGKIGHYAYIDNVEEEHQLAKNQDGYIYVSTTTNGNFVRRTMTASGYNGDWNWEEVKWEDYMTHNIEYLKSIGMVDVRDDPDEFGACPTCGADADQQCSYQDPTDPKFGIEVGGFVHKERLNTPMQKNEPGDSCPECGAKEVMHLSPRTAYECGSSDYDGRPGTFLRGENCNK